MKNQPYRHWTESEMAEFMGAKAMRCGMGTPIRNLITDAIISERWDPTKDYIGSGALHDDAISQFVYRYLCVTGQGGKDAQDVLYHLMKMESLPKWERLQKLAKERFKWIFTRWFYNSQEYSIPMIDAVSYINR